MEYYKEVGNVINTYDELYKVLKTYITDEEQLKIIDSSYHLAEKLHDGQYRKSGEPYITHPLNVAYIAASYSLDYETICASLLHDVVEDTNITLEEINEIFGNKISELVDGVTKITNMKFLTKDEELKANQNKILHGMCHDVRILFIKLADRLHNMRTISVKDENRRLAKANETYELYVPLAYRYGLYRIKEELEDISLYYRDKIGYIKTCELLEKNKEDFNWLLDSMSEKAHNKLNKYEIDAKIEKSIKNVHGVYRRLNMDISIENMHDLLALKIIVPKIDDCYLTLGIMHSLYNPVNERIKDYIFAPKSNNYRSLHTVLFSGTDYLVQARIRTPEMNLFATSGIMTYYQNNSIVKSDLVCKKLIDDFRFFRELALASSIEKNGDVSEFVSEQVKQNIRVYTPNGERIELPEGSTPIDVAYKLGDDFANHYDCAFVNNKPVNASYALRDGDIIKIIKNYNLDSASIDWLHCVNTSYAKEKLKSKFMK